MNPHPSCAAPSGQAPAARSLQPLARGVDCGAWKLAGDRAMTLLARERSVLDVVQGRAWITVSAASWPIPPGALAPEDRVLCAGDRLLVEPGQHLVMQAWREGGTEPVLAFRWDRLPALQGPQRTRQWQHGVVQPARELAQAWRLGTHAGAQALRQAGSAGARLALGLLRCAWGWAGAPLERRHV